MAESIALAVDASRLASLLLSYILQSLQYASRLAIRAPRPRSSTDLAIRGPLARSPSKSYLGQARQARQGNFARRKGRAGGADQPGRRASANGAGEEPTTWQAFVPRCDRLRWPSVLGSGWARRGWPGLEVAEGGGGFVADLGGFVVQGGVLEGAEALAQLNTEVT